MYIYIYTYTCNCVYIYMYIYIYVYVFLYVSIWVCVCICNCLCLRVFFFAGVYLHVYVHVYMHLILCEHVSLPRMTNMDAPVLHRSGRCQGCFFIVLSCSLIWNARGYKTRRRCCALPILASWQTGTDQHCFPILNGGLDEFVYSLIYWIVFMLILVACRRLLGAQGEGVGGRAFRHPWERRTHGGGRQTHSLEPPIKRVVGGLLMPSYNSHLDAVLICRGCCVSLCPLGRSWKESACVFLNNIAMSTHLTNARCNFGMQV